MSINQNSNNKKKEGKKKKKTEREKKSQQIMNKSTVERKISITSFDFFITVF